MYKSKQSSNTTTRLNLQTDEFHKHNQHASHHQKELDYNKKKSTWLGYDKKNSYEDEDKNLKEKTRNSDGPKQKLQKTTTDKN